tara:strand:- start:582 stop:776 length:195 start_codon:yes stop_codon:yes gene_type:complete
MKDRKLYHRLYNIYNKDRLVKYYHNYYKKKKKEGNEIVDCEKCGKSICKKYMKKHENLCKVIDK